MSQEAHPCRPSRLASCGKLLAMALPAFVGDTAYSLYLWHWPVLVLLTYNTVGLQLDAPHKALGVCV